MTEYHTRNDQTGYLDPCTQEKYTAFLRLYSQFSGNLTTETIEEQGNTETRTYYNGVQIAARATFPND